jgi:Bacterial Ig-like domain (group 3)
VQVSGITNLPFFGLVADRGICGSFDTATTLRAQTDVQATVTSANNVPDGTVDFLENGAVVASALLVNGVARWNPAADLPPGVHTIVASFAGSTNFKPSMSAATQITVAPQQRHRAAGR